MSDEQAQQADDPSGDGWRWVNVGELLRKGDMFRDTDLAWTATTNAGAALAADGMHTYRRRIEQQQPQQAADDPSGPGWRDLGLDEPIEQGDVYTPDGYNWLESYSIGRRPIEFPNRLEYPHLRYRRRIEQQQPSDSETETIEDLRRRLAECEVLLAEADRSGQQVNAELQQLREQLATTQHLAEMSRRQVEDEAGKVEQLKEQMATLTWERDRYRNQLEGAIGHSSAAAGRQQVLEELQAWLRPVLELVAEHPEDASPLAVAVLGFLPGIASRLIEE